MVNTMTSTSIPMKIHRDETPVCGYQRMAWDLFFERTDQEYSFADCVSFALMHRLGLDTDLNLDVDFTKEKLKILPRVVGFQNV